MKTPREVLFARHHDAQARLDALRQEVLADLPEVPVPTPLHAGDQSEIRWSFRAFLRPFRWHLSGLSAAWLLVVVLNSEPKSPMVPTLALQGTPPPRQLLMAFREHRRQLWELLQPPVAPTPTVPHAFAPPRRSDPAPSTIIA